MYIYIYIDIDIDIAIDIAIDIDHYQPFGEPLLGGSAPWVQRSYPWL